MGSIQLMLPLTGPFGLISNRFKNVLHQPNSSMVTYVQMQANDHKSVNPFSFQLIMQCPVMICMLGLNS